MRAIIEVEVPDYQIGQEVSIYFKDTMMIKGIVQEPKTGHWKRNETIRLTYCSECGFGQHIDEFRTYNYCPNCGCRMVEPQESEVKV